MGRQGRQHFHVLITDGVDECATELLKPVAEVTTVQKFADEDALVQFVRERPVDAIIVRSATRITARVIAACQDRLRLIARAGVGVDNVDVVAASEAGIFVVNSPQGNTVAAGEHTIGLMFALARRIAAADASAKAGRWERGKFMGVQLQGKTLAVIGLGQVGGHVCRVAAAAGMRVVAYDPYANPAKAQILDCELVPDLRQALQRADFVSLHVPLLPSTANLINAETLAHFKKSAYLINCSRGGIIDEEALVSALSAGGLAGAALDVFTEEGKALPARLRTCEKLLLTPHLGASTVEAQSSVARDVAEQVRAVLQGGLPTSAVNLVGFGALDASWRPAVDCCFCLSRIAMQLLEEPLEEVTLSLEGEPFTAAEPTDPLLLAAVNGALSVHAEARVNFVNVRQIAEKHAIKSVLTKKGAVLTPGLRVTLCGAVSARKVEVAGHPVKYQGSQALLLREFCGSDVYLVMSMCTLVKQPVAAGGPPEGEKTADSRRGAGGLPPASGPPPTAPAAAGVLAASATAAAADRENEEPGSPPGSPAMSPDTPPSPMPPGPPAGYYLYTFHDDAPGILGAICVELGKGNTNIGNCHLGRRTKGEGGGVALFQIDTACKSAVLEAIAAIDGVERCGVFAR